MGGAGTGSGWDGVTQAGSRSRAVVGGPVVVAAAVGPAGLGPGPGPCPWRLAAEAWKTERAQLLRKKSD